MVPMKGGAVMAQSAMQCHYGTDLERAWAEFFGRGTLEAEDLVDAVGADRIGKEAGADLWLTPEVLERHCPLALEAFPLGMPVQVKSSIPAAKNHLQQGWDRGRIIPVVVGMANGVGASTVLMRLCQDGVYYPNYVEKGPETLAFEGFIENLTEAEVPFSTIPPRWVEKAVPAMV
jgi:hypothetical protein